MEKTRLLFALFMLASTFGISQQQEDQTLFGKDERFSIRGFVGINTKGVEINQQIGILPGAEVDIVINHALNVGFFGYGMVSDIKSSFSPTNRSYYNELALGGIKLEPVFFSHKAVHFTLPVNMGIGGISTSAFRLYDYQYGYTWDHYIYDYDVFAFVEPGLGLEFNIFKHLRLNAGASYLLTDKINLIGTNSKPLDGLSGNISLRFGWF